MKKFLIFVEISITLIFSGIILLFVFNHVMDKIIHSKKDVVVPQLQGKSFESAIDLLSQLNLGLIKEAEEYDTKFPPSTILRQYPQAGMTVRENKIVRVVISKGGEVVYVPNLIGLDIERAKIEISNSQLLLGEVSYMFSLKYSKGVVTKQDPPQETVINKNTMINLSVSKGPPPPNIILLPDFKNKKIEEATAWTKENKIPIVVDVKEEPTIPQGTILSQSLPPDTVMKTQDTIFPPTLEVVIASSGLKEGKTVYYEIPQGSSPKQIKVVVIDRLGEREVFNEIKSPGEKLNLTIYPEGNAKVRIFSDNILVEESYLE